MEALKSVAKGTGFVLQRVWWVFEAMCVTIYLIGALCTYQTLSMKDTFGMSTKEAVFYSATWPGLHIATMSKIRKIHTEAAQYRIKVINTIIDVKAE